MRASCVKVLGRPTDDAADMLRVTGDDEKDDKHSEARTRAGAAGRPNVCVAGGRGGRATSACRGWRTCFVAYIVTD